MVIKINMLCLVIFLVSSTVLATNQGGTPAYVETGPMIIDGSAQLRSYASAGDGSAARPFLIEHLRIDAKGGPFCLEIRNVLDHFVIRRCWFAGASESAVRLENVRNGWIVDSIIENSTVAVSCLRGVQNVVFAGNTFRNNIYDAQLRSSSVQWDDGYMGNYWSAYVGVDENGDGIGDKPYSLFLADGSEVSGVDRFPLMDPNTDTSETSHGIFLRISYTAGDQIELRVSRKITITTSSFIFRTVAELSAEQRIRQQVLTSPGTGFFSLEEAVIEDSGTLLVNGVPQPYESSSGTSTIRRVHRLGAVSEPGYGVPSAELAQVNITAQLPARRVSVGDQWRASWSREIPDWEDGQEVTTAAFLLESFEIFHGDLCAVIRASATSESKGTVLDPLFGRIPYLGRAFLETRVLFSISKGRIVQQTLNGIIEVTAISSNIVLVHQRTELSVVVEEAFSNANQSPSPLTDFMMPREIMGALALLLTGDFSGAEQVARWAAVLFHTTGQTEYEATALWIVADAQMRQEKYREAIDTLHQALSLFELLSRPQDEVACLNSLGLCHRRLGEHDTALRYYEKAVALAGEDPEMRSIALVNMGICLIALGDYTKAIACFEEAKRLRVGRDVLGQVNALNSLAICYRKLGQYEEAHRCYDEALSLCDPTNPEFVNHRVIVLANKGSCYIEQGFLDKGLVWLLEAQKIAAKAGDPTFEAGVWIQIARCQQKQGKPEAAMASLERALILSRQSSILGSVNFWRGWCYLDLGVPTSAIECFEAAQGWAREGGDFEALWRIEWGLARSWWALKDRLKARDQFERALTLIEKARAKIEDPEVRKYYLGSVRDLYQDYIDFLYECDDKQETFWIAERARARTFLELIYQSGGKTEQFTTVNEGLKAGAMDPQAINEANQKALTLLSPHEAILSYFVTDRGVYIWTIAWDEAKEHHSISAPMFLEYPRDGLMRDVIGVRKALEPQEIKREGEVVGLTLGHPEGGLAELYRRLVLPPLETLPEGVTTLVIIPSGPLWYVPWAALPMTDQPPLEFPNLDPMILVPVIRHPYLIEKYTLVYLPSLASLVALEERKDRGEGFLGLANPKTSVEEGIEVQRFVELEKATQAFARTYAGENAEVYAGEEAAECRAHTQPAGHTVVVYACHGKFNPRVPLQSKLLLAPGKEPKKEGDPRVPDGDYHAWEVLLTEHQGVELVVLAACETLLPAFRDLQGALAALSGEKPEEVELTPEQLETITTGDEVVGLARAFLSTGARSVLATLWQASPHAVEELLVRMAQYQREGKTWAEALAQAQRDLLQIPQFTHPWFWAPYILIGRW